MINFLKFNYSTYHRENRLKKKDKLCTKCQKEQEIRKILT